MASGHCKDCRFFDGSSCPKERASGRNSINPGNLSSCFVDIKGTGDQHCRTCRFFDSLSCPKERASGRKSINPGNSSCGSYSSYN